MTWCPNDFKLEVYDPGIGMLIKKEGPIGFFYSPFFIKSKVLETFLPGLGQDFKSTPEFVQYCIDKKCLSKEWLKCAKWFWDFTEKSNPNKDLIWRSITQGEYEKFFLKYGSTTAHLINAYEDAEFEEAGLPKSDFIWASTRVDKGWEYAIPFNPSILIGYRKKFFIQGRDHPKYRYLRYSESIFVKAKKEIDYRDTVEVVFRIYWLY